MNSGLYSKYNKLFCSDLLNMRTKLSWRSSFDKQQYVVDYNYGLAFYTKTLDDAQKLEQRFFDIKTQLDNLENSFFAKINEILKENPTKSLILNENENEIEYCDYCYIDKKTNEPNLILGIKKEFIKKYNESLNYSDFIVADDDLQKLKEKKRNLLIRYSVFYNALSLSLRRLIEAKSGFADCTKQYYKGELTEPRFRELFNKKIISLNFSGREYLYFFDTSYSRIPELKEICWSDGKIMRLAFGETNVNR